MSNTKVTIIDKPWGYAIETPDYYDVEAVAHHDAQHDDQTRVLHEDHPLVLMRELHPQFDCLAAAQAYVSHLDGEPRQVRSPHQQELINALLPLIEAAEAEI